jgi:hypothetical protein
MKRTILLALLAILLVPALAHARGHSSVSFGFGIGFSSYSSGGFVSYSSGFYRPWVYRSTTIIYPARPVYVVPAPVYVAPAPVYVAPAPVYVAPAPVYVAPAPVYVAPAPVVVTQPRVYYPAYRNCAPPPVRYYHGEVYYQYRR